MAKKNSNQKSNWLKNIDMDKVSNGVQKAATVVGTIATTAVAVAGAINSFKKSNNQ